MRVDLDPNESPINLFNIDYEEFPAAEHTVFLENMSDRPTGFTARDMSPDMTEKLEKDIIYPPFYHKIGNFRGI